MFGGILTEMREFRGGGGEGGGGEGGGGEGGGGLLAQHRKLWDKQKSLFEPVTPKIICELLKTP